MTRRPARFDQWLRLDRMGAAAVELAIAAPVLAIMLLGIVDGSLAILSRMGVDRAARAGTEYAIAHGYDAAGISSAITGSTSSRPGFLSAIAATPAPTQFCACASASTLVTATCGSTCTGGAKAGTYVKANAEATYTNILNWPGRASTSTISSSSTVRIQ